MSDRVKAVAPPDGRTMMTTESVARKTQKSETEAPREPAPVSDEKQTDVAKTVARLRKTFASGRTRSVEWRKQQLRALQKLMDENEDAIAAALAEDLDRNPFEAYLADIATTSAEAKYAAKRCAGGCGAATCCSRCRSCPAAAGWSTSHMAPC